MGAARGSARGAARGAARVVASCGCGGLSSGGLASAAGGPERLMSSAAAESGCAPSTFVATTIGASASGCCGNGVGVLGVAAAPPNVDAVDAKTGFATGGQPGTGGKHPGFASSGPPGFANGGAQGLAIGAHPGFIMGTHPGFPIGPQPGAGKEKPAAGPREAQKFGGPCGPVMNGIAPITGGWAGSI